MLIWGSIPACAGEPDRTNAGAGAIEVYPRVCGGTFYTKPKRVFFLGLSPRVRGNRRRCGLRRRHRRSIPACAGEPTIPMGVPPLAWVYPRVCGGTRDLTRFAERRGGLSPRVRGNLPDRVCPDAVAGSIPACAGEPLAQSHAAASPSVYPRVCGGTFRLQGSHNNPKGLSPRVRGNLRVTPMTSYVKGSIPACAGEPRVPARQRDAPGVYPRVCGGTHYAGSRSSVSVGLSPRVRGNPARTPPPRRPPRSIPACAGEPPRQYRHGNQREVYPRVCGGTAFVATTPLAAPGLSPRVRGNRPETVASSQDRRSIPACAGEPMRSSSTVRGGGVYPRVCGGTIEQDVVEVAKAGLSPRVRGNRGAVGDCAALLGSIPACAGEPLGVSMK